MEGESFRQFHLTCMAIGFLNDNQDDHPNNVKWNSPVGVLALWWVTFLVRSAQHQLCIIIRDYIWYWPFELCAVKTSFPSRFAAACECCIGRNDKLIFVKKIRPFPSISAAGSGKRYPYSIAFAQTSFYCPACCISAANNLKNVSLEVLTIRWLSLGWQIPSYEW